MENIIKKILLELYSDTGKSSNKLKESEEEFSWVGDLIKEVNVQKGDVFYIVDQEVGIGAHSVSYKPKNVRYLFFVTDIIKGSNGFRIKYQNCFPKNISYDPKKYNPTKHNCRYDDGDGYESEIDYISALNLINKQYWRLMGNNGYYSHLTESEEDSLEWTKDLHIEPFHLQLIRDNPRKPVRLEDVKYIMFNPSVEVGDKRFNKIAYFLEDNDYYPETLDPFGKKTSFIKITRFKDERQNGRWNIGPELSEQELYNLSQTKNNKYWAEEFIYI